MQAHPEEGIVGAQLVPARQQLRAGVAEEAAYVRACRTANPRMRIRIQGRRQCNWTPSRRAHGVCEAQARDGARQPQLLRQGRKPPKTSFRAW